MRPDPYKRARSRAYKFKHGIADGNNSKAVECNVLPQNTARFEVSSHMDDNNDREFDLNLDSLTIQDQLSEILLVNKDDLPSYPARTLKHFFGKDGLGSCSSSTGLSLETLSLLKDCGWKLPNLSSKCILVPVLEPACRVGLNASKQNVKLSLTEQRLPSSEAVGSSDSPRASRPLEAFLDELLE